MILFIIICCACVFLSAVIVIMMIMACNLFEDSEVVYDRYVKKCQELGVDAMSYKKWLGDGDN